MVENSGNNRIVLRPGDEDLQAEIGRSIPGGFTRVYLAVAVWVFKVVGNSIAVSVLRIPASVGNDVVIGHIDPAVGLFYLITAGDVRADCVLLEPDLIRSRIRISVNKNAAGENVISAQGSGLVGR